MSIPVSALERIASGKVSPAVVQTVYLADRPVPVPPELRAVCRGLRPMKRPRGRPPGRTDSATRASENPAATETRRKRRLLRLAEDWTGRIANDEYLTPEVLDVLATTEEPSHEQVDDLLGYVRRQEEEHDPALDTHAPPLPVDERAETTSAVVFVAPRKTAPVVIARSSGEVTQLRGRFFAAHPIVKGAYDELFDKTPKGIVQLVERRDGLRGWDWSLAVRMMSR